MKKKWFKIMLISIIVLLIGCSIFIMYVNIWNHQRCQDAETCSEDQTEG